MNYGSIYLIKNTINGKCYIGQTTVSVQARWKYHIKCGARYSAIHHAIVKYGPDKFLFIELCSARNEEDLNFLEEYFIKLYDSCNSGYNLTYGGDASRGKFTPEVREKIRKSKLGNKYRKHANKSGRLEFKKSSHAQRLGDDPPSFLASGDYKSPTSSRHPSKYRDNKEQIIALYQQTNSSHEVAKILGLDRSQVFVYLKAWGVAKTRSQAHKIRNIQRYSVDTSTISFVHEQRLLCKSVSELCRKLNMPRKTVDRILRMKI